MVQILHPSASTTKATRRNIQNSQKSIAKLAKHYGINPKTVVKWKKRDFVQDAPRGPKNPHSTVLSRQEEAVIVTFRKHTRLPLDDCLYSLQKTIPKLNRSNLYRCLKRHGVQKLPSTTPLTHKKITPKKFKKYPIGYFHIDITEVRTKEGKQQMYVAVDRTSKFAYAKLYNRKTAQTAAEFLKGLLKITPYKIHTILTDNGRQFTHLKTDKFVSEHIFDRLCKKGGIQHRLTKVCHPWTNGQVERMNRIIKSATTHRYFYSSNLQLNRHLNSFLNAYNFGKRLKTLNGKTSYEFILSCWTKEPKRFKIKPTQYTMKPYM